LCDFGFFSFLDCYAAILLALQFLIFVFVLAKLCIRMVRGSQVAQKRWTKYNGSPAMDLGIGTDHVR